MIYLASPYSDPDPEVRAQRYRDVLHCAANMMRDGHAIYCPIGATHPLAEDGGLEFSHDQWLQYDRWFLDRCDQLWVLQLPGWDESKGVLWEIGYATARNKPVVYFSREAYPCDPSLT